MVIKLLYNVIKLHTYLFKKVDMLYLATCTL